MHAISNFPCQLPTPRLLLSRFAKHAAKRLRSTHLRPFGAKGAPQGDNVVTLEKPCALSRFYLTGEGGKC